ncbi:MAG TPA: transferrin receptor-like dimerization domain-containing protein [Gemmatimonadaceae bacterium]|nr:transferrin receptor-like dimerization domain-containing protein [Gemmatimonadaceae bacterium]
MRTSAAWMLAAVSGIVILPFPLALPSADPPTLRGYTAQSSHVEREWENKFRAIPSPDRMRESMRLLSAHPHHVGSPYQQQNAQWLLARFKEWGWDAQIESFDVLFPTPRERVVELVAPTHFTATLREPAFPQDPTSSQQSEQLPTYNAYSADGDVTAPLVYVNYGIPADYEVLERNGISVKGAIVIARYGGSWRGIKPKLAAEHGAVGTIIYSDPRDDGYARGDVFPEGPYRPRQGVQRGSVMDMPTYPGDPLTPGVGATKDAHRLAVKDALTLTKIPVLPISYGDAQPLLAALGGRTVPESWRGALPITYHFGPGPARVHLRVRSDWNMRTLHDVIARIPGTGQGTGDQWVIRGNHYDGWVNGAGDPIAGQSALLEEARAMGELRKQGWQPRRTIIYAAWDGEEPGLLGSTEWAEAHAAELAAHAVIYINTDGNGRGFLNASGSHVLEKFLNGVARDIEDPETGLSVWKRTQLRRIASGGEARQEARSRADLRIGALGSGSDYTPFVQHLGIPSLALGFGGEDGGGVYHSVYDDFYWYTHFSDTSFVYGRALAQTVGTAVMRLADAQLLPYDFTDLAETVQGYAGELRTLAETQAKETAERNREIEEGVFKATMDPREPTVPPKTEPLPPRLAFDALLDAADSLTRSAGRYERALGSLSDSSALASRPLERLNALLLRSERVLTDSAGLPRRPWFRHLLYAPGYYTGYGVKTMPGVREAIEQKQWKEAQHEMARVSDALLREAELVSQAAALLAPAERAASAP